jgi:hypothetical protein
MLGRAVPGGYAGAANHAEPGRYREAGRSAGSAGNLRAA